MKNFNHYCDTLLLLFIGTNGMVLRSSLVKHLKADEAYLNLALDRMMSDGLVRNLSGQIPHTHQYYPNAAFTLTGKGYAFIQDGGYQRLSKQIFKERRKLQLDSFKIGWEMVISLISLGISFYALYLSTH